MGQVYPGFRRRQYCSKTLTERWKVTIDYPQGHLGVIQEGAYANILLIDDNPIDNLLLLMDKDNITLIMKDGKIYKNAQKENRNHKFIKEKNNE